MIGCVYSIDKENLEELDRQEGVHQNIYEPKEITVIGSNGKEYLCRTYWKRDVADGKREFELASKVFKITFSQFAIFKAYVSVIISGAKEHKFPDSYVAQLEAIEHNGIYDIPMLTNISKGTKEADEPEK